MAEEARAKQEEDERLRKEREKAWELGLYSYVSDSFSDSEEEEKLWKEPDEDWELGGVAMYRIYLPIPIKL